MWQLKDGMLMQRICRQAPKIKKFQDSWLLTVRRYETTKAGDAVRALKASLRPQATARRDGVWQTLDAAALVPGDLVLLASGSHVPADCRVRTAVLRMSCVWATGQTRFVHK